MSGRISPKAQCSQHQVREDGCLDCDDEVAAGINHVRGTSEVPPDGAWYRGEIDRLRTENTALRREKNERHQKAYEGVRDSGEGPTEWTVSADFAGGMRRVYRRGEEVCMGLSGDMAALVDAANGRRSEAAQASAPGPCTWVVTRKSSANYLGAYEWVRNEAKAAHFVTFEAAEAAAEVASESNGEVKIERIPRSAEASPDDLGDDYRNLRATLGWIEERTGEATDDMAVSIRNAAREALDAVIAPCRERASISRGETMSTGHKSEAVQPTITAPVVQSRTTGCAQPQPLSPCTCQGAAMRSLDEENEVTPGCPVHDPAAPNASVAPETVVCATGVELKLTPVVGGRGYIQLFSGWKHLDAPGGAKQVGTQLRTEEMTRLRDWLNTRLEPESGLSSRAARFRVQEAAGEFQARGPWRNTREAAKADFPGSSDCLKCLDLADQLHDAKEALARPPHEGECRCHCNEVKALRVVRDAAILWRRAWNAESGQSLAESSLCAALDAAGQFTRVAPKEGT